MLKLPNVIIGGAPKCGTSSLYNWLIDHRDVCHSTIKETFYLMDKDNPFLNQEYNYHLYGLEGYQKYFSHCNEDCKLRIEATTHYLYQQTALEVLGELTPLPIVIFLLRKPSHKIYSDYQFTRNNLAALDQKLSFTELINLIQTDSLELLEKYSNPRTASNLSHLIDYCNYLKYLRKWQEKFGNNLLVFLFEELINNPSEMVKKVAKKLDIDPEFYDQYDFVPRNQTLTIKNKILHSYVRKIAKKIPKNNFKHFLAKSYLKLFTQKRKQKIADANEPWGERGSHAQREADADLNTIKKLDQHFAKINQELSKEFNLDLSLWD